jgi:hypothetical protein
LSSAIDSIPRCLGRVELSAFRSFVGRVFVPTNCDSGYRQSMADNRNAFDKHLGITEQGAAMLPYARYRALREHVGQALSSQNYAAAQVYALLMIAETQEEKTTIDVNLNNWEDLAIAIASHIAPDLQRIADAVG